MIKKVVGAWFCVFVTGVFLFWRSEQSYLKTPGLYLTPTYRGIFFSDIVHGGFQKYSKTWIFLYLAGSVMLLPASVVAARHRAALTRQKDYKGNIIGHKEMDTIEHNYQRFAKRQKWEVQLKGRNELFVGVDMLTGENITIKDEMIFKGILIVAAPGMGKTESLYKVILKQLALDPIRRTSFVIFTLNSEDAEEMGTYLKSHKHQLMPFSMCNILDLAMDRTGGLDRTKLTGLMQKVARASALGSDRDPFWVDNSVARLVENIYNLSRSGQNTTLGRAYGMFRKDVEALAGKSEMDRGLLETFNAALGGMTDPSSRMSLLYSPNQNGGLHLGVLRAASNRTIRRINRDGTVNVIETEKPMWLPWGLYEIPPNTRMAFDWPVLMEPISVILPPPGESKGEIFAANFVKMSLLTWIREEMSGFKSRLFARSAKKRFRFVLAEDECHNFAIVSGDGLTDAKALAECRKGGLVAVRATQDFSGLKKSQDDAQNKRYINNHATRFFGGVAGADEQKLIGDNIGRVRVKRINRSYGRSEDEKGRSHNAQGHAKARGTRANVTESIREEMCQFITEEDYGRFEPGMFVMASQGKPHRVIYCPEHDRVKVVFSKGKKRSEQHEYGDD